MYRISKYDVTNAQYVEFLNAKDPTGANTLGLYSSFMTSDANIAGASDREISTARLSGVVSRMCGGVARWRTRRLVGVSPVRASMVTGRRISCTGRVRLRAMGRMCARRSMASGKPSSRTTTCF